MRSLTYRVSSGSTFVPSAEPNRSNMRLPISMCCHSGTGRCSCTITFVSPRTETSHSPNSSAFDTVAESDTIRTDAGGG